MAASSAATDVNSGHRSTPRGRAFLQRSDQPAYAGMDARKHRRSRRHRRAEPAGDTTTARSPARPELSPSMALAGSGSRRDRADRSRGGRVADRPRPRADPRMRGGAGVFAALPRSLTRAAATLVRDGTVWQPGQNGRLPPTDSHNTHTKPAEPAAAALIADKGSLASHSHHSAGVAPVTATNDARARPRRSTALPQRRRERA